MSPLNAAICTTTYLERQKCYGPDKKILFKKPLFDLEVKSQGHRKVIMVRDTSPYGHAPTYQISLTYLERNNYLTLRSKVKVQQRSLWYATYRPMVMHIIDLSRKTKMLWPGQQNTIKKKNYLTLRSKVKVPQRSLRYTHTHRLMVMHPHTKYH